MTDAAPQKKKAQPQARYVLRLFITGATPRSLLAIENIRHVCEAHIPGGYDLEIIDLYEQPQLAESEQILASPTLVKHAPEPPRRFVGDMSDAARLVDGLGLQRMP